MVFKDFSGISLKQYIPDNGLDLEVFLKIALRLCSALLELHSGHEVHQDLNPGNIMINPQTVEV